MTSPQVSKPMQYSQQNQRIQLINPLQHTAHSRTCHAIQTVFQPKQSTPISQLPQYSIFSQQTKSYIYPQGTQRRQYHQQNQVTLQPCQQIQTIANPNQSTQPSFQKTESYRPIQTIQQSKNCQLSQSVGSSQTSTMTNSSQASLHPTLTYIPLQTPLFNPEKLEMQVKVKPLSELIGKRGNKCFIILGFFR